jgi:peptidoglycan/LPS O-acetylase OafA/YrhL
VRGVAVLLVLVSHADMTGDLTPIESIARLGDFGVKIFFVLSGFLITGLLVDEHRRTGRIDIGRFMIRRAFRILPAAYVFMLSIIAAATVGWVQLQPGDALHALSYTMNFAAAPAWWLGHLWSVSIEEQYYLAWPLILALARPRWAAHVLLGTIVAAPLVRAVIILSLPGLEDGMERGFVTAVDGFAAGGLLAVVRGRLEQHAGYMRAVQAPWVMALVPLLLFFDQFEHRPLTFYVVLQPLIYIGLAFCLHRTQIATATPIGRVLNWQPLVWLGTVSYSLYLWQQPFLAHGGGVLHVLPLAAAISVLFAWVSYQAIERPFLRLRDRWFSAVPAESSLVAASPGKTGVS